MMMRATVTAIVMVTLIFSFSSCKKGKPMAADPIAHTDSYDIWPDSIDLHNDIILRVMNDSVMEIRVNGNPLDSILCPTPPEGRMTFKSDYPVIDFLYRLEAATPSSGRFTASTPYEIYLNPLQTDSARELLQAQLAGGVVIPYRDSFLEWPAVNVNAEWLLAATELATANGNSQWRRTVEQAARQLIAADNRFSTNPSTGLYTGIPRYMAAERGIFPPWMTPREIGAQATLAVNMEYCAAMKRLGFPTDSLRHTIDNELWIPNMGYFSALSYGFPTCQTPLQVTDNLAQSIAILSGQLSDAMAETVIRKTPIYRQGVTLFQPQLPPASGSVTQALSPILVQTAWTIATAKVDNREAYSAAVGALFVCEGERLLHDHTRPGGFRSTFTSFILRALAGMEFNDDGIFFVPNVPDNIPGDKIIKGVKYRDAELDIKISGTGRAVATFSIDGKPSVPFFDGSLKGHHDINITLGGPSADPGSVTQLEKEQITPLPPETQWEGRNASLTEGKLPDGLADNSFNNAVRDMLANENAECRLVYLNGILQEEIYRDTYELYEAQKPTVVQFTEFYNSQLSGYSSAPYLYLPARQPSLIYASQLAKSGTKVLENKEIAARFVESNRYKNRIISFDYTAPASGSYMIDIRYINGLGVINSQRKLTLRQLLVNSRDAGIFFFPQLRSASEIDNDSWQEQTTWSNPLVVNLEKGINHLELRYFQPSPVYVDPNSHVILFDLIRIIPAPCN